MIDFLIGFFRHYLHLGTACVGPSPVSPLSCIDMDGMRLQVFRGVWRTEVTVRKLSHLQGYPFFGLLARENRLLLGISLVCTLG